MLCVCVHRVVLFRDENDVKSSGMTLSGEPVDWSSHEGQSLLHLLIPSSNVTNFRIAHEVAHLKKQDGWWDVLVSPIFLVGGYHFSVFFCQSKFTIDQH